MSPEFVLDITKEDWEKATSKFITFDPSDKVGTLYYRDVELGIYDWKTPGQSLNVPVRVTEEGQDFDKEASLFPGVSKDALFRTKEIFERALGLTVEYRIGADKKSHVVLPDPMVVAGKLAVGCWQLQVDERGAEAGGKGTKYTKLITLYPAGYKPAIEELV